MNNPHPGEPMAFGDLVRNYVLNVLGCDDRAWQADAYLNHWIRLERRHASLDALFAGMCDGFRPELPHLGHLQLARNAELAIVRNQLLEYFKQHVLQAILDAPDPKQELLQWIDSL
jgi:hypothetical protein